MTLHHAVGYLWLALAAGFAGAICIGLYNALIDWSRSDT